MTEPVIEIRDVTFSYNGAPALVDVSLTIGEREFVSVIGPNGGGKTTLLKLVLGLLQPSRGEVRVFGRPPREARSRIGYVTQHGQFDLRFPVRVIDVVLMGRLGRGRGIGPFRRADRAAAEEALREVELLGLRDRPFAALSGGERQRVLIARALAVQPDLLLLDEPTANVDIKVERQLGDLLRDLNKRLTVVVATHELGFVASYVERVICVNRRVVQHPTSALTGEMISDIYGSDICAIRHDHNIAEEKG